MPGRFVPAGETDSEYAFCYIMNYLEKEENLYVIEDFEFIHELFCSLNKFGLFNCIMSNGKYLFCYYDKEGFNGLHYLNLKGNSNAQGYVISTHPLLSEEWISFGKAQTIVFKDGDLIFSS